MAEPDATPPDHLASGTDSPPPARTPTTETAPPAAAVHTYGESTPPSRPATPRKTWRARLRNHRLRLAALATGLVGLLLIGAFLGHLIWPKQKVEITQVTHPVATKNETAAGMPDVLGMREDFARRALADAGMTGTITTSTKAVAGPPGVVINQTPNPGASDGNIALVISSATTMPKLAGTDVLKARATLTSMGAVVLLKRVTAFDKPLGTVVSTRPQEGQQLTTTVELDVADAGQPRLLAEATAADKNQCDLTDNMWGATKTVNHEAVDKSLICQPLPNQNNPVFVEYSLDAHTESFSAQVGFVDPIPNGAKATATVRGDGKVLWSQPVVAGKKLAVQVPTRGVKKLRLEITAAAGPDDTAVGWIHPSVFGLPDQLALVK